MMADPSLHGNGKPCPACALRREEHDLGEVLRPETPCNLCGGAGRIPIPPMEIVAASAAWAAEFYWPAFDARNRK